MKTHAERLQAALLEDRFNDGLLVTRLLLQIAEVNRRLRRCDGIADPALAERRTRVAAALLLQLGRTIEAATVEGEAHA